jgi:hypothetical protein
VPPGRWSARHVPTRTSQDGAGPSACKSARPAGTAPAGMRTGLAARPGPGFRQRRPHGCRRGRRPKASRR